MSAADRVGDSNCPPDALARKLTQADPEALLLVDFDETLLLRNSTELFLDAARPAVLAACLTTLVDIFKPWRRLRRDPDGFATRDWLRVLIVAVLMPWTLWRWRHLAPALAASHVNQELIDCIRQGGFHRVVVVSHGFRRLILPLLRAMPLQAELVASSLRNGFRDRAAGKRALLTARFGTDAVGAATVITDHALHDADLLGACARPLVVAWPEARYERAFRHTYIPLLYTERAKHPNHPHLINVFLGRDWLALVLASAMLAPEPLLAASGLALLLVSFAVIYDVGYHENDILGYRFEARPIITPERLARAGSVDEPTAWLFAILLSVPGVALLSHADISTWATTADPVADTSTLLALWIGWLGLVRATFALFNRVDEQSRILLHLPLQVMKGIGVVLCLGLPLAAPGAALLVSIAVATWIPYVSYRMTGVRSRTPERVLSLLLFLTLLSAAIPFAGLAAVTGWQAAAVLLWLLFRARGETLRCWRQARLISRQRPHSDLTTPKPEADSPPG